MVEGVDVKVSPAKDSSQMSGEVEKVVEKSDQAKSDAKVNRKKSPAPSSARPSPKKGKESKDSKDAPRPKGKAKVKATSSSQKNEDEKVDKTPVMKPKGKTVPRLENNSHSVIFLMANLCHNFKLRFLRPRLLFIKGHLSRTTRLPQIVSKRMYPRRKKLPKTIAKVNLARTTTPRVIKTSCVVFFKRSLLISLHPSKIKTSEVF